MRSPFLSSSVDVIRSGVGRIVVLVIVSFISMVVFLSSVLSAVIGISAVIVA